MIHDVMFYNLKTEEQYNQLLWNRSHIVMSENFSKINKETVGIN